MGLGKTLQTICIIASDHARRSESSFSTEKINFPSLIVCPPSLCRHWLIEFQIFAPFLKPLLYVGKKISRIKISKDFQLYDVIITSYETLKTDLESCFSGSMTFNYMVLDEGHISMS